MRAMRGKTLETVHFNRTLGAQKASSQSTVKLVLPSNKSYESKTGCNRTIATVLWVPLKKSSFCRTSGDRSGQFPNSFYFRSVQGREICIPVPGGQKLPVQMILLIFQEIIWTMGPKNFEKMSSKAPTGAGTKIHNSAPLGGKMLVKNLKTSPVL